MKLLIPIDDLDSCSSRQAIPIECVQCTRTFHKPKNEVQRALKGKRTIECCSPKCRGELRTLKRSVAKRCPICGKSFTTTKSVKTRYCSQTCSNRNGNPGRRSELVRRNISEALKRRHLEGKHVRPKTKEEQDQPYYPRTNLTWRECSACQKLFFHIKGRKRKVCSRACRSKVYSDNCKGRPDMCKNNNRHSGWYESPIAGRVWLESTWEVKVAKMLDEHQIEWNRPRRGWEWTDEGGKGHRYYPDFYLPEYNIYLDPKHPYAQIKDAYKINDVRQRHGIIVHVLSKKQLTFEYIIGLALEREAG